jgi:hypothetical protein
METWDVQKSQIIKTPEKQINFLNEIRQVCKKHGLSISHEDKEGAFEIENFSQDNIDWLMNANMNW